MKDLEQAARQALEALETVTADVKTTPTAYEAQRQAIEALSQALEDHESAYQRGHLDGMAKPCIDCADRKLQAFKQPKQEPVAWYDKHGMLTHDPFEGVTPLYTEPPKRKPLTDEEIGLLTTGAGWSHLETPALLLFARAIEAVHGIGENT